MVVRRRPQSHISLSCNGLNVSLEVTTFFVYLPVRFEKLKTFLDRGLDIGSHRSSSCGSDFIVYKEKSCYFVYYLVA